jgi:alkyl sulfatase BDS1-like metallo-beta-lactamase superfamily hydrolase
VPEFNAAFIGDLIIGSFPNIGNPWKPTRFTLDWAKTLKEVRAKNPDHIFFNGAGRYLGGQAALDCIDDNIEVILNLHDQVIDYINKDMHISEIIHVVKVPDHLKKSPYLQSTYSRPEFFVYNTYRWYHGYFDHNPAHLIPRPEKEVHSAIMEIIEDPDKILNKASELLKEGQVQLGLQVLDVLIQARPNNIDALKLRIEMLEKIGSEDTCLMSKNTWVYFIDKDKKVLENIDLVE